MNEYTFPDIKALRDSLLEQANNSKDPASILKDPRYKELFSSIASRPDDERAEFGRQMNALRQELVKAVESSTDQEQAEPIDVTSPMAVNSTKSDYSLMTASSGSIHPVNSELDYILDIFSRMGFEAVESKEIDDDFHMFGSLNFPEDHPARDDFDTLQLKQTDPDNRPLVAAAHTSTMQTRVISENLDKLAAGHNLSYVIPGRVFRNEDLDARHEQTFNQIEGVYVGRDVTVSQLMSTLHAFINSYFNTSVEIKVQPFYFPFTEPSFEFAAACPYCNKTGCSVCSNSGWIELLGCGLIHPNVLSLAGADPEVYSGFAWGIGFMRLTMIKYQIEDIRHLLSGKLEFLRQFQ